ncbi:MAG: TolC family protein [Paludibacteraceae bacterium]
MKRRYLFIVLTLSVLNVFSQTITLDECQDLAQQNFPLAKQKNLIDESSKNNVSSVLTQYFPQVQINGQASYQSDVTRIELGNLPAQLQNISFPEPSLDQYKVYADVAQTVYDGGMISNQRKLVNANNAVEKEKVAVEMYKLKDRINQTYFGILLMDEQLKQTDLLQNDLQTALDKVNVMVKNGVSLISNRQNLEAEMLKVKQTKDEVFIQRQSFVKVLSLLTGKEMDEKTVFAKSQIISKMENSTRPELNLITYQQNTLKIQNQQLTSLNIPKISLFAQGGYGKPGLNMFTDKFEPYFVGGIRLNWQLSRFYTLSKDRNNLKVQEKSLELQKDIFNLNQQIAETQQNSEITKLQNKLKTDDGIVALRTDIKNTSKIQLENGVLTSADFIRDANAENQARQTKSLHEMQLLLAQYSLKWIKP